MEKSRYPSRLWPRHVDGAVERARLATLEQMGVKTTLKNVRSALAASDKRGPTDHPYPCLRHTCARTYFDPHLRTAVKKFKRLLLREARGRTGGWSNASQQHTGTSHEDVELTKSEVSKPTRQVHVTICIHMCYVTCSVCASAHESGAGAIKRN